MGPKLWSQSVARRSLVGGETHNPTPAAFALIKSRFGKRRSSAAVKRAGKLRRRFHRGNPAPAAVIAIGQKLFGGRFGTPSEKKAGKVAGALVSSAADGNLTAAKAIEARTAIGIAKERAVWQAAWAQVPKRIKDLLKKYADQVPGVDHSKPEVAAAEALSRAVDANEFEEAAAAQLAMTKAERAAVAREQRASRERTFGTLADVGVAGLQAFAGRGRRPARRRKRRSSARRISF